MERQRNGTTLRRKLTAVSMATTSLALIVAGITLAAFDIQQDREALVRDLTTQARVFADNSTAAVSFESDADARRTLELLKADPEVEAAAIYDADGKALATYFRDPACAAAGIGVDLLTRGP